MKKLILLMFVLLTASVMLAQATNEDKMFRYTVENVDFENLSISGKIDVFVSQADTNSVEIRYLEPDRMEYVKVEQKNGILSISTKEEVVHMQIFFYKKTTGKSFKNRLQVYVGIADIKQLSFGSYTNVTYLNDITVDSFTQQIGYKNQLDLNKVQGRDNINLRLSEQAKVNLGNIISANATFYVGYKSQLSLLDVYAETFEITSQESGKANIGNLSSKKAKIIGKYKSQLSLSDVDSETCEISGGESVKVDLGKLTSKNVKIYGGYNSRLYVESISAETLEITLKESGKLTFGSFNVKNIKNINLGYKCELIIKEPLTQTSDNLKSSPVERENN